MLNLPDWGWLLFGWALGMGTGLCTGYFIAYIRFIKQKKRRFEAEAKAFEAYFEKQQAERSKNRFDL